MTTQPYRGPLPPMPHRISAQTATGIRVGLRDPVNKPRVFYPEARVVLRALFDGFGPPGGGEVVFLRIGDRDALVGGFDRPGVHALLVVAALHKAKGEKTHNDPRFWIGDEFEC